VARFEDEDDDEDEDEAPCEVARSSEGRRYRKQPKIDALRQCEEEILEAHRSGLSVHRIAQIFRERGVDISASTLRAFLARNYAIRKLISFGHNLVFADASTYTGILLLSREARPSLLFAEIPETKRDELPFVLTRYDSDEGLTPFTLKELDKAPWQLTAGGSGPLLKKLSASGKTIADVFTEVLVGVQSGIDDVHVLREVSIESNGMVKLYSEREKTMISVELEIAKPFLTGSNVNRYEKATPNHRCIYPYFNDGGKTRIFDEGTLRTKFPHAYSYLKRHKEYLTEIRIRQKTNPEYWYSCHRSRDMNVFEQERIVGPEISQGCNFTIVPGGIFHNTQVYSYVPSDNRKECALYWLGILNSKVLWWFLTQTGTVLRGGYFRFKTNYLRPFPVPIIDYGNKAEKDAHDRIVSSVEKILSLHMQRATVKTPGEQTVLTRLITATNVQIEREVYALYRLTSEEVNLVERY
jgi:hypothetical protein